MLSLTVQVTYINTYDMIMLVCIYIVCVYLIYHLWSSKWRWIDQLWSSEIMNSSPVLQPVCSWLALGSELPSSVVQYQPENGLYDGRTDQKWLSPFPPNTTRHLMNVHWWNFKLILCSGYSGLFFTVTSLRVHVFLNLILNYSYIYEQCTINIVWDVALFQLRPIIFYSARVLSPSGNS